MVDYNDCEKRRISTSSQTNYADNDKILSAIIFAKPYSISPSKDRVRKESFKIPSIKTKPEKVTHNKVLVAKNINSPVVNQAGYCKKISNAVRWTNLVFDNFPVINSRTNRLRNNYLEYDEEKISKKKAKHKNSKIEVIGEELFRNINERPQIRKERKFSMHKTFYDIFAEINQRMENDSGRGLKVINK